MICDDIIECSEELNSPRRVLVDRKGGGSKHIVDNPNRNVFFEIDFENCVYEDRQDETKCDYGIKTGTNVFYIELKGSDVSKGVDQLLSTIRDTRHCFADRNIQARLIVSKFPKPELVKQRKEYKDLIKIVNQNLIITQNIHTEVI